MRNEEEGPHHEIHVYSLKTHAASVGTEHSTAPKYETRLAMECIAGG